MHRAIIVHPSWIIREIIKEDLAACNCQVVCNAASPLEAVLAFRLHRPDIILIDSMFNESHDLRLIDAIQGIDRKASIVVMVSPDGDNHALHAVLSGADGFVVLPSRRSILQGEIRRVLQNETVSASATPMFSFSQVLRSILTLAVWRPRYRRPTVGYK